MAVPQFVYDLIEEKADEQSKPFQRKFFDDVEDEAGVDLNFHRIEDQIWIFKGKRFFAKLDVPTAELDVNVSKEDAEKFIAEHPGTNARWSDEN